MEKNKETKPLSPVRVYIIKDTRHERVEGKPCYLTQECGTETSHEPQAAFPFTDRKAADRRAKAWVKIMDYATDQWVSVVPMLRSRGGILL